MYRSQKTDNMCSVQKMDRTLSDETTQLRAALRKEKDLHTQALLDVGKWIHKYGQSRRQVRAEMRAITRLNATAAVKAVVTTQAELEHQAELHALAAQVAACHAQQTSSQGQLEQEQRSVVRLTVAAIIKAVVTQQAQQESQARLEAATAQLFTYRATLHATQANQQGLEGQLSTMHQAYATELAASQAREATLQEHLATSQDLVAYAEVERGMLLQAHATQLTASKAREAALQQARNTLQAQVAAGEAQRLVLQQECNNAKDGATGLAADRLVVIGALHESRSLTASAEAACVALQQQLTAAHTREATLLMGLEVAQAVVAGGEAGRLALQHDRDTAQVLLAATQADQDALHTQLATTRQDQEKERADGRAREAALKAEVEAMRRERDAALALAAALEADKRVLQGQLAAGAGREGVLRQERDNAEGAANGLAVDRQALLKALRASQAREAAGDTVRLVLQWALAAAEATAAAAVAALASSEEELSGNKVQALTTSELHDKQTSSSSRSHAFEFRVVQEDLCHDMTTTTIEQAHVQVLSCAHSTGGSSSGGSSCSEMLCLSCSSDGSSVSSCPSPCNNNTWTLTKHQHHHNQQQQQQQEEEHASYMAGRMADLYRDMYEAGVI